MVNPLVWLITTVLNLYSWVVIIYIILQWLIIFNIINQYQPFVRTVMQFLSRLVEPALRYIRRFIPAVNGVDLSPIALLILVGFASYTITWLAFNV